MDSASTSSLNNILMESGLDLFSKFNNESKQMSNLEELDPKLLPNLQTNSIVEISGASRTGKSILVLKYITKSILPISYENINIQGLGLNVLLVDMELKFSVRILMEEMEHYLKQCLDKESINSGDKPHPDHSESKPTKTNLHLISDIIQDSLARLQVTFCHSTSDNLALIFQNIETRILSKQLNLDIVFIENLLNFYFEDVSVQICSIAKYVHKLLTQCVLKYLSKFNTVLIYTRYIEHGRGRIPSGLVTHSVQLSNINYNRIHKCLVNCEQVTYYRIERQELMWTEFNEAQLEGDDENEDDTL
uniref:Uncharacterized protein n=1 Tax=Cacopsylla melanoneura TaxID=428564 RepID=A0A8D8SCC7_9HEMI